MGRVPGRIVYFTDAPYFGGAERYLELLVRGLDKKKYHPCVMTGGTAGLESFLERLRSEGVETARVPLSGPYDLKGYSGFLRVMRRLRPAILHLNLAGSYDAQASLLAPLARAGGCRRVVTTEHLAMIQRLWKRYLAKKFSSFFVDSVISITYSNLAYLTGVHGLGESNVAVIHNGIDVAGIDSTPAAGLRSLMGVGPSTFIFSVVGSLIERKGHRFLLEALAELRGSSRADCVLAVVGTGQEEESLKSRALELGLGGSVFFLGHRDDAVGLMKEADCLVVPSLMEGMPFVILEAMAASKPVIASNIYGIPEVVLEGETGLLVPPEDAGALRDAMRSLLQARHVAAGMGARGRERILGHFTVERMVRDTEKVYQLVLSGRGNLGSVIGRESETV